MALFLIILLIILNGLFAMSEMALVSSKKARLQQMVDKGSIGAVKAIGLQENPAYFLSSIQVGITTISILSGIFGEKSLIEPVTQILTDFGISAITAKPVANVLVIVFLTFLSVVFGEIIPKRIGLVLPEKVAVVLSIPMFWISRTAFPVVWLFKQSSEWIMKLFGLHKIQQAPVSNEEIKEMMERGAEAGVFHESEQQIVANVLHMDEKKVETIMTHRGDLFYIDMEDDFNANIEKIVSSDYSRIIVTKGGTDNILGIVHLTKILQLIQKNEKFDFTNVMEEPLYVPETITTTQVLENFKRRRSEMAVVVNEYGANIGIVTLVDIMEAIVGDIAGDDEEGNEEIQLNSDGSLTVDGLVSLDKLANHFELDKLHEKDGFSTLAGLLMEKAGAIPKEGAAYAMEYKDFNLEFLILKMQANRVLKVRIIKKEMLSEMLA
jgi:putative hemolysin